MNKLLQLRQSQLPNLPFKFFGNLEQIKGKNLCAEREGRYVIVPTDITVLDSMMGEEMTYKYNVLIQMAKAKGFSYLMLMYV